MGPARRNRGLACVRFHRPLINALNKVPTPPTPLGIPVKSKVPTPRGRNRPRVQSPPPLPSMTLSHRPPPSVLRPHGSEEVDPSESCSTLSLYFRPACRPWGGPCPLSAPERDHEVGRLTGSTGSCPPVPRLPVEVPKRRSLGCPTSVSLP